jgi:CubicO group peptidase (beta-lactamase class C family)
VTVRQLLAHTAGIAEYTDVEGYETSASSGRSEDDHFATLALELPLQFPPGTQWRYSNTGYWLLQKVIERVTVDSLPHALASRILTPAGLAETSPDCPLERIATGYTAAWRLGLRGDSIVDSPSRNAHRYNLAAAGLCSTATDVARFLGSVVSGSIIGSASLADMTERVPASARSGAGLFVQEDSEGLIFSHSGGGGNGNSEVMAFPRDSLVFAAITNTGGTDLERLIRDLRRQVLGVPQPIVLDLPMKREEWLPILGTYLDPLSRQRVMVVSERAGAPYGFGGRLRKQADGSYVSEGYRDQRLTFPVLPDGTTEVVITAFGVVVQRGQRRP